MSATDVGFRESEWVAGNGDGGGAGVGSSARGEGEGVVVYCIDSELRLEVIDVVVPKLFFYVSIHMI